MKKIGIVLIFTCLSIFSGQAQKKIQGYFGLAKSTGIAFGGTSIGESEYSGFDASRERFSDYGFSKSKLPITFGMQLEAGIVWKEKLMIGTGFKYLFRQEEGVYYCHVCDLWVTEPSNLNAYFLEIPLRIQLNLMEDKPFFPTFSSEIYWSKAKFEDWYVEDLHFWGFKLGVGMAKKIKRHQLTLESQFNKTSINKNEYPNYSLKEILLNFRWTMSLF